jgi:bifunctional DNA-binding transcriptional regulator/antitoxin component of YhaV-PrlF toxin-antitoxin module
MEGAMPSAVGVVREGRIVLPQELRLQEGLEVRVEWAEGGELPPLESEPLTEEDIRHEIEWATGQRWRNRSS